MVSGSGGVYSSMWTPRARNAAIAARMSGTRQAACVWVSDVPAVLRETIKPVPPPARNTIRVCFGQQVEPKNVAIEVAARIHVGRQQDREYRVLVEHLRTVAKRPRAPADDSTPPRA